MQAVRGLRIISQTLLMGLLEGMFEVFEMVPSSVSEVMFTHAILTRLGSLG